MKHEMKLVYEKPQIEIILVEVEKGYASSNSNEGIIEDGKDEEW